jgi:peptide/nickel transport system substrate-binding protein
VPCGLLRPGEGLAMTEEELTGLAGFSKNIEESRKEARRLLREAGVAEGSTFEFLNRPEYEPQAIWLIDQWRQIGLNVNQKILEVGAYYKLMRGGDFKRYALHL